MNVEMFFGHRVPKSKENKHGWERIDIDDIDTTKPVLLCFGGNNTTIDRYANFMAKTAERLLNITPSDKYLNIYSISYHHDKDEQSESEDEIAAMSEKDISRIVDALFLPLVTCKDGRISTVQAQKNMRNINIFSFSYGSKIVNDLTNAFADIMVKLGYTDDETKDILKQIFHLAYAPKQISKAPTTFALKTFADNFFGRFYEGEYRKLTGKSKTEPVDLKCGELVVNGNTLNLYAERINDRKFFRQSENEFDDYEARDMYDDILPDHDIRSFLLDENWAQNNYRAEVFARCGAYALGMAVFNSKKNEKEDKFMPLFTPEFMKDVIYSMELKGDNERYGSIKGSREDDFDFDRYY